MSERSKKKITTPSAQYKECVARECFRSTETEESITERLKRKAMLEDGVCL